MRVKMLKRESPSKVGVSAKAITNFLYAIETERLELHSLIITKNNQIITEGYYAPYSKGEKHQMNSITKSITSTAIGFAVEERRISIEDSVISFFPEYVTNDIEGNMKDLKVKHLLSMSTGHKNDTLPILWENTENWVKAFLETPITYKPGRHFLYNTGASYMLSAILEKITSESMIDYLTPRLFDPLGISDVPHLVCPNGISIGGYGMKLSTQDLAKFGLFYLNHGKWNEKQLLPKNWIEESINLQVTNGEEVEFCDWSQGYGYQFWRCQHGAYRADGAFGQFCIMLPKQNAVLAITSGLMEMQEVLNNIWQHLLPGLEKKGSYQEDIELQEKLESLTLLSRAKIQRNLLIGQKNKLSYNLEANEMGYIKVLFSFTEKNIKLTLVGNEEIEDAILYGGFDNFIYGETTLLNFPFRYGACASWESKNRLKVKVFFTEYAIHDEVFCHFVSDSVRITTSRNVWSAPVLSDMARITTVIGAKNKNKDAWIGVTNTIE